MKIIRVDNYDREIYDDILVAENIYNDYYGEFLVNALNNNPKRNRDGFYKLVENDYKLYKFEP